MIQESERDTRSLLYEDDGRDNEGTPVTVICTDGDDALCQDASGARAWIHVDSDIPTNSGDVLLADHGEALCRLFD